MQIVYQRPYLNIVRNLSFILLIVLKVSEEMRCRIHSYLSHGHVVVQSHYKAPLIWLTQFRWCKAGLVHLSTLNHRYDKHVENVAITKQIRSVITTACKLLRWHFSLPLTQFWYTQTFHKLIVCVLCLYAYRHGMGKGKKKLLIDQCIFSILMYIYLYMCELCWLINWMIYLHITLILFW